MKNRDMERVFTRLVNVLIRIEKKGMYLVDACVEVSMEYRLSTRETRLLLDLTQRHYDLKIAKL